MRNQNTPIATEGYPFIAGFAILTVITALPAWKLGSGVLSGISALFAFLTLFTIYFFRNPERTPPADERAVVARTIRTNVTTSVSEAYRSVRQYSQQSGRVVRAVDKSQHESAAFRADPRVHANLHVSS